MNIPKNIIVHHSGGTDENPLQDSSNYTIQECDSDHRIRFGMFSSMGWWVGYNYFMDKLGTVTQTRTDLEEGAHCVGYNNHPGDSADRASIGICLAGNFDATLPTQAQISSLKTFLNKKVSQYGILKSNVVPHRAHAQKTCYGEKLSANWASDLVDDVNVSVPPPAPIINTNWPVWYQKFVAMLIKVGLYGKGGMNT